VTEGHDSGRAPWHTAAMEGRPPVWIGHAVLRVNDVNRSAAYWQAIGMREVGRDEHVAVLELRGGTHLVLLPGTPEAGTEAPFDLMVDDLEATRAEWDARGLDPSPIESGRIHSAFTVRDPDGYVVTVNSSHVVGEV
jgi:catechol 2,3-dioxygenase-like lactoylglutathione lyase family enzyme